MGIVTGIMYTVCKGNDNGHYLFSTLTQKVDIFAYGSIIHVSFSQDGTTFEAEIEIPQCTVYTVSVSALAISVNGGKHQIIAWFQSPVSKL